MKLRTEDKVTVAELARRVDELEKVVDGLKSQLEDLQRKPSDGPGPHDWTKSFGIFADDPTYDEAMRLGREWRKRMNRRPEWKGSKQRRQAKANDG